MSVGYSSINSITLDLKGNSTAKVQEGVFIADVKEVTQSEQSSTGKINYYRGTILETEISLENKITSKFIYKISLYNNSTKDYIFIDDIINDDDLNSYTNTNIKYTINGIAEYNTIIKPKETIEFTIEFEYVGENTTNNTLKSMINFRFKEVPTIELTNENQTLTLNKIYPNYTPQEYSFNISNYNNEVINEVSMKYNFEIEIDKPLTAKIYDNSGNEVTESIDLIGNSTDKFNEEYVLKIFWDNSNPEENIEYNDKEYADKNFSCEVHVIATPENTEYLDYNITKEFFVDIKSAPLHVSSSIENDTIELNINEAKTNLNVMNYISDKEYNEYDVKYNMSLDSSKYNLNVTDSNNGILSSGHNKNTIALTFNSIEAADLNYNEEVIVKLELISPYKDEQTIKLNIINSEELIVQNIEYNVSYTDMYSNYTFTSSNGWRILDPGTLNLDGTYSNTKIVTTGIPVKLYYNASSGPTSTSNQSSKWWGTYEQVNKEYGLNFSSWTSGNSRYFAAYGMKYNFKSIPFSSGTNSTKNKGYYTKITNSSATSTTTGEIFINDNAKSVHALLKEEMNLAINKMQRNNDRVLTELDTLSATVDPRGMFYLRALNNYDYTSSTTAPYWLGTPNDDSTGLVRVQATGTFSGGTDNTYGVRPVITLNKKIKQNNGVWQIVE